MTERPSWRLALAPGSGHGFSANPGWWDIRGTRQDMEDIAALRWRLLHALPPLRPGGAVLDLGGGTGTLIDLLADFYPHLHYTLLDPNPAALARAGEKLAANHPTLHLDLVQEAIAPEFDAPFAGADYTLVTSTISLHDIVRPALLDDPAGRADHHRMHVGLLRRALASLEPGGHLIYADAMHPGFRVPEHLAALREADFSEVDVADARGRYLICGGQRT